MSARRYELSDFEWLVIDPLVPNKPRGVPRVDDRKVLNGIYWWLRTRLAMGGHSRTLRTVYDVLQPFRALAQYVTTGGFKHSNTAENFFSIFKRGVIGTYHHMSEAHLARYCAEFDFRYNTRKITDAERTDLAVKGAVGKRLTYRQPASLAA